MKKILLFSLLFNAQFSIGQNSWQQKADFAGGLRANAVAVVLNGKVYAGLGNDTSSNGNKNDWYVYDPSTDVWNELSPLPAAPRVVAAAFSAGNKVYVVGGWGIGILSFLKDCWEYDPSTDVWTQKADFGGGVRNMASAFSVAGKGYIVGGQGGIAMPYDEQQDTWQYDPVNDVWNQKADFPGGHRVMATAFSINNKGYCAMGKTSGFPKKDFWEYDPSTNTWTGKSDFPGAERDGAVSFSIDCKGYVGTGTTTSNIVSDFWEYDQNSNAWNRIADITGPGRTGAIGFSIAGKGYVSMGGTYSFQLKQDLWQYTPDSIVCATGVNEFENNRSLLSIYPNPSTAGFTLSLGELKTLNCKLSIYDVAGRLVYEQPMDYSVNTISCSLTSSVYLVKVNSEEGIYTQKLVIE